MAERAASPGDPVVVTYLEMTGRPRAPVPPAPMGQRLALLGCAEPPDEWFVFLYRLVGAPWNWTDWIEAGCEARERFLCDPRVELFTLMLDGAPGGFFMLDTRTAGVCDLSYFGLAPRAIGRRLGRWFLATAVETGWERPGVAKLTVNTCTLDHPRALGLYQSVGFEPVRRIEVPPRGGD